MSTAPPFIPSANDIIVLWRIYLDRVDPVTKIIHVPSFRPLIVDAAAGFRNMPPQKKGLLFAMFTVACLALSRQEHLDLLGRRKEDTIDAYSASFKAVLVRYGYLNNYDLDTLRSLVLYAVRCLIPLSAFHNGPGSPLAVCPKEPPRQCKPMGLPWPTH